VGKIDIKGKICGLVDDFFIERKIHVSVRLFLHVFVRAHDAPEVTETGQFHPEADRGIREF
jgi:hypothetical protein